MGSQWISELLYVVLLGGATIQWLALLCSQTYECIGVIWKPPKVSHKHQIHQYVWAYGCPSLLARRTVQSALLPGAGFDFDSHNKGTFHSRLSGTIAQDFI